MGGAQLIPHVSCKILQFHRLTKDTNTGKSLLRTVLTGNFRYIVKPQPVCKDIVDAATGSIKVGMGGIDSNVMFDQFIHDFHLCIRHSKGARQMEIVGMMGDDKVHLFFNGLFRHFWHQVKGHHDLMDRGFHMTQEQARIIPFFRIGKGCIFVHKDADVTDSRFHVIFPPIVFSSLRMFGNAHFGVLWNFFPYWKEAGRTWR